MRCILRAFQPVALALLLAGLPGTAAAQMIILWPGETAPKGWHFCNGALLSKADHAALFEAIGTTYGGSGDKFALPDLRKADEESVGVKAKVRYVISDGFPGATLSTPVVGQITLVAFTFPMRGHAYAEGQPFDKKQNASLYDVIGDRFSKYYATTSLPDIRTRLKLEHPDPNDVRITRTAVIGRHPTPTIALDGLQPDQAKPVTAEFKSMEPFIGQVVVFSGSKPPRGWAVCKGQQVKIDENEALFTLVGTIYGGDGRNTFGIPNLTEKDKILKRAAGLEETSEHLFHMIAISGIYPSRR